MIICKQVLLKEYSICITSTYLWNTNIIFILFFWPSTHHGGNLSSPGRDQTDAPCSVNTVLTTGPPGKSGNIIFKSMHYCVCPKTSHFEEGIISTLVICDRWHVPSHKVTSRISLPLTRVWSRSRVAPRKCRDWWDTCHTAFSCFCGVCSGRLFIFAWV